MNQVIEVGFVMIVLKVHLSLWINVSMHFKSSMSVFQLWVVMEKDSTEWLEAIWVDRRRSLVWFDWLRGTACHGADSSLAEDITMKGEKVFEKMISQ